MEQFLNGNQSLVGLLASAGVEVHEIPEDLLREMDSNYLSHEFIWAWCQAATLFGRSQRLTSILCQLLSRDDHENHEDVADTLQDLKAPQSIGCLFERTTRPLAYLDYDDNAGLARRCVWALHDIGTTSAIAKLQVLCRDERKAVASEAKERLKSLAAKPGPERYRMARDASLGSL